ncbi:CooT family nickel-binding protein [Murimonas intestini]|uniref:RNA-binding protein n=1 Tax=Murimonas intestini TaxID=1337051 RepID=A0AB73SXE8_9FIRM|nr:CooT family nickel-binding protein [Murimonas intestini]MCR1838728.1 CooT family nickel-binding protein [Murimonas intestini]MCR1864028.1 CooT family nickel-binding protein [Murimonas intestini]MCR1881638.1 CooT family nickel-binding protein [Murimonas intestini]
MCLATVYNISKPEPESIVLEYVSRIDVNGTEITLTDVMGERKVVEGTISMVDLTGGVVKINCPE